MNPNFEQNDDLRIPDDSYMDTLLPTYQPIQEQIYIPRRQRRQIQRESKKKGRRTETNNGMNIFPNIQTMQDEEEIIRQSIIEYEENQRKHINEMEEQELLKQSLLEYEETERNRIRELEENILKLSLLEYEETQKIQEKENVMRIRKACFENTKKQLEKLKNLDRKETYYTKLLEYISLYENECLEKIQIDEIEYEKFLKIIKQIRLPENEKTKLLDFIVNTLQRKLNEIDEQFS